MHENARQKPAKNLSTCNLSISNKMKKRKIVLNISTSNIQIRSPAQLLILSFG
jgi:hypothetical protein